MPRKEGPKWLPNINHTNNKSLKKKKKINKTTQFFYLKIQGKKKITDLQDKWKWQE
jgi:hypothetical protein